MYCFILHKYKFYNFMILSGLLLFVFGVDKFHFADYMTHFTFLFSSNKCANYPKYRPT